MLLSNPKHHKVECVKVIVGRYGGVLFQTKTEIMSTNCGKITFLNPGTH